MRGSGTRLGSHLGDVSKASKQPGVEKGQEKLMVSSLRSPAKVNNPSAGLPKRVYEVFCKPSLAM